MYFGRRDLRGLHDALVDHFTRTPRQPWRETHEQPLRAALVAKGAGDTYSSAYKLEHDIAQLEYIAIKSDNATLRGWISEHALRDTRVYGARSSSSAASLTCQERESEKENERERERERERYCLYFLLFPEQLWRSPSRYTRRPYVCCVGLGTAACWRGSLRSNSSSAPRASGASRAASDDRSRFIIPLVFESGRDECRGEDVRECSGKPRDLCESLERSIVTKSDWKRTVVTSRERNANLRPCRRGQASGQTTSPIWAGSTTRRSTRARSAPRGVFHAEKDKPPL